jgi:hypothetical protein
MPKRCYRIIPKKYGPAVDVEMTEPGSAPRVVNTFNREAEAWEWINEQEQVDKFAERLSRNPKGQGQPE